MKRIILTLGVLLFLSSTYGQKKEKYQPNWKSLRTHQIPQWAKDAKFGIYAHWGVYSVTGNWDYTRPNWANYYITGYLGYYQTSQRNEQANLFRKNVGDIKKGIGYKDLAKQFKAENFDPKYWAKLIKKSGAKYAGICAVHHDGYCMWDSKITNLCAGKLGPQRDIISDLYKELRNEDLKIIATFHHGRTYKHFQNVAKRFEGKTDYANVDLLNKKNWDTYWYMGSKDRFAKNRYDLTVEFINKYKPDILWFDGGGGKFGTEKILSHFFNMGEKENKEVCLHNKGNFGKNFGIYSYENGAHRPSFVDWPWEDDTPSAIGWCDWQWNKGIKYKKSRDVIVRLCDLVARNGGLLLSMNPRPDGTFDKEQENLLLGIGAWLEQNGEAIYGTSPWVVYGEGHLEDLFYSETNPMNGKKSRAIQPNPSLFNKEDVRFTTKNNALYATFLGTDFDRSCCVKTLKSNVKVSDENKIVSVELLGYGKVKFHRNQKGLHIDLPKKLPNKVALSFKISVKGTLLERELNGTNGVLPLQT
ncbi:alpha-L-fucosidase [Halosquirtibacter laminarini]|uniref:Alpha-L-fucosidase n=1 Tax=Halosquirtibacter laminarini TaxID=3374600 RepID=A0AC61NID5_9BACT|nr:alpha-L-fucosidase [Prolixibacteraceae bacterium]